MPSKVSVVRLVIGCWCLLTLVLLNVYNGTLVSYVTSALSAEPIVKSMEDLIGNSSVVHLLVDRGQAFDMKFKVCRNS